MLQAHVYIRGIVQCVGYRYFVKSNARSLNLSGWVRNTEDRGVEAVFQSSKPSDIERKKQIEKMIVLCHKGPFLSEVRDLVVEWENGEEQFLDFSIR